MLSEAMGSKLVVGVDGSVASDAAVRWAGREALMRGLPLTVVNVVAPTLISSTMAPNDTITQGQEDRAREILDRAHRCRRGGRQQTAERPRRDGVRRCGSDASR
jgi:nucleotide-binding universal stress UspA family protein